MIAESISISKKAIRNDLKTSTNDYWVHFSAFLTNLSIIIVAWTIWVDIKRSELTSFFFSLEKVGRCYLKHFIETVWTERYS